ncbi:MAG: YdcF family protein [Xanthomonadales bacterium]|nr:YdcF family protein [Xanthomonadales bacterium]
MLNSLVSPLRFGLLVALVLVLAWRHLGPRMRVAGVLVLLPCLALTTPFAANALVGLQEARGDEAPCAAPYPSTIVVLGGGVLREAATFDDFAVLSEASLRRLIGAVELQRETGAQLVASGGVSRYTASEASLFGALALRLGVPADRLVLEQASRTTWQNAQFVAALDPPIARRIALVTSAVHMARARYAFEQAGFEVCTHAVDRRFAGYGGVGYFLPATSALVKSDGVLHELAGELAYRLGLLRDSARDPHRGDGEH